MGDENFAYRFGGSWRDVGAGEVGATRHKWLCDFVNQVNKIDGVTYNMTGTASSTSTNGNLALCGSYTSQNKKVIGVLFSAFSNAGLIEEEGIYFVDVNMNVGGRLTIAAFPPLTE